jgi:hypothetical protein
MRKQRRLWFGDWNRDEPDQVDTVVITSVDEEDAPLPERPRRNVPRGVTAGIAIALLALLGFAVSSGGDNKPIASERSQTPPAQTPQVQPQIPQSQVPQGAPPQGFGGPDLTGPDAVRAAEAAVARFPGDVERVTRGPGGSGYIVHVIQPEGDEVHVAVDDQFKVQGSDAGTPPAGFGPGASQ